MNDAMPPGSVDALIVDDDALFLRALQRSLLRRGITAVAASTIEQSLTEARNVLPRFALIDLKIGTESGLNLIQPLKAIRADMRVVLMTGYASVATAVEAIKLGADNYLLKPVTAEAIMRVLTGQDAPLESESTMTPLSRLEWEHIQQALSETSGNISAAARLLGMHRRSLQRKLAKRPGAERSPPDKLK